MQLIKTFFKTTLKVENGIYIQSVDSCYENQNQINDAFSEKLKFWNKNIGWGGFDSANFDCYSTSNAFRCNQKDLLTCEEAGWSNSFLHSEEAC